MPPRLTKSLLTPLLAPKEQIIRYRSRFSTTAKTQAEDPWTTLLDSTAPAERARPSQIPITSRFPSVAADPSNPALRGIPLSSRKVSNRTSSWTSDQFLNNDESVNGSSDLIATVQRSIPARNATRKNAVQRDAEKRQYGQQVRQIEMQATRNWHDGDVYSPHDLSPVEMQKARQARLPARSNNLPSENTRKKGGRDVLDDLGVDPLKEYKNFALMSEFMTEMGRIRHSRDTGLRAVNQRRMAKAVRRAIGIGIMPSVHRHPELMEERQVGRKR